MAYEKHCNPHNIPRVLKHGNLLPHELDQLIGWYETRLCERQDSDQGSTVYGLTLRALKELASHRGRSGCLKRKAPQEPKLPKLNTRQLHVLALVKHARRFIDPIKDESILLALLDKGALSGWYEMTEVGEKILAAQGK